MDKSEIVKELKKKDENLKSVIENADKALSVAPGRSLHLKNIRGKPAFYCHTENGSRFFVSQSDEKQIKQLSTAYYAKKIRSAAVKEKKQIDACLAILGKDPEASDIGKVEERIPEAIKKNAVLSELTNEGYARKWQKGNDIVKKWRSHKKDDYHKYETMGGDYVGSKSEVMIADRLYANGIPYHYEIAFTPEVVIDESRPVYDEFGMVIGYETLGFSPEAEDTLHPDFYVLNKRTRKGIFWEHLGRMDDPEYCRKNFNRFMRILDAGYVIGEDLIVTHEDSRHPLLPQEIERIIEKYFR